MATSSRTYYDEHVVRILQLHTERDVLTFQLSSAIAIQKQ